MDHDAQRLSFGARSGRYDAHRPDWPRTTAQWLVGADREGSRPGDVLDLGAGTGKLTGTLVGAGHRVVAGDPSPGMLSELAARWPGVGAVRAVAERLPFRDASFDAITFAQAWHWVEPVAAVAECARVLRPGGSLGIAWHVRDTDVDWVFELDRLVGDPVYSERRQERRSAAFRIGAPFGETEAATFRYEQTLTPAALAELASTWSYVALRDDHDDVLAAVDALGRRVAGAARELTLPYVTYCYRARV
jgi:SAM-dependent methyltransferase